MRKKIVALLMALTMVPALAACGSSNGTGNNTAGAPGKPPQPRKLKSGARGRLRQKPMQNLRQKHRLCPAP
jgi:hypothetical protein